MSENTIVYYAVYGQPMPDRVENDVWVSDLPDGLVAVFVDEDDANEYDYGNFNTYVMPFEDFSEIPVWRRYQPGDEDRAWHNVRPPKRKSLASA